MAAILWEPEAWAELEFGECELGDIRRNKRMIKLAVQTAARPDEGTPDQTETWGDCKAAYRLFHADDISFQAIIEPHCRHTREACVPGNVKLILNDTTELNFTSHRAASGLGSVGNGGNQKGFFIHSGLMVDAHSNAIDGLAGQELFYRPFPKKKCGAKRVSKNSRRRDPERESAVWGRLIDRIGQPPVGVKWLHVCDRGADDYEVMLRAKGQNCGFVIRAAKLNRIVESLDENGTFCSQPVADYLAALPSQGERKIKVKATGKQAARVAMVSLRFGEIVVPEPKVITPWIREHRPSEPLRVRVVELREMSPPPGCEPIRWVLYTTELVTCVTAADLVINFYERRWTIEDYHKCYKTGCAIESRRYETAERLERVAGFLSIVAVRLLRLRTAATETPDRPAREVAPQSWIAMLKTVRKLPTTKELTVREFVRALAGLGGHLGRKHDGEPGWITLWRGYEKLQLLMRGYHARKECG